MTRETTDHPEDVKEADYPEDKMLRPGEDKGLLRIPPEVRRAKQVVPHRRVVSNYALHRRRG